MNSDAQLVERVRGGEVDAFADLITRYERSLVALALSRLRDMHAAEDVVQAAFLKAFQKLETLRDARCFGAWLLQIARQLVVDAVRSRREQVGVPAAAVSQLAADGALEQRWIEREHLLHLVEQLSERERLLIGLRYYDGLSVAHIAAVTDSSTGTVTKQLSRAHEALRSLLKRERQR